MDRLEGPVAAAFPSIWDGRACSVTAFRKEGRQKGSGSRPESSVESRDDTPCVSSPGRPESAPFQGVAPLAQLDRASASEAEGRRFEFCVARFGILEDSAGPLTRLVGISSPSSLKELSRRPPQGSAGSIRVWPR